MDDPFAVRRLQRRGDLHRDRRRLTQRNRPACDRDGEILALDQFHHERERGARLLQAVNLGDVGMVEGRQHAGFPLEAGQAVGIGRDSLRQHLDRDVAMQPRVPGAIDLAHAAGADGPDDFVGAEACTRRQRHLIRRLAVIVTECRPTGDHNRCNAFRW